MKDRAEAAKMSDARPPFPGRSRAFPPNDTSHSIHSVRGTGRCRPTGRTLARAGVCRQTVQSAICVQEIGGTEVAILPCEPAGPRIRPAP